MKLSRRRGLLKSVFTKLLAVIILTGIGINLSMGFFFHFAYRSLGKPPLQKNLVQYADYLIADLGDPPDRQRALEISRKASLQIQVDSPERSWSTGETISPQAGILWHTWPATSDMRVGRYRGRHLIEVTRGDRRYFFQIDRPFVEEGTIGKLALLLLGFSTIILAAGYWMIRRILEPVGWLRNGVRQVSKGDLESPVAFKSADELGELTVAFNTMTRRIREMLKAREQLMLDVSHELRSPLTRMRVALEFLPDHQSKQSLREDIDEMEKMVTEILESARLRNLATQLNIRRTDVAAVVDDVLREFQERPPGIECVPAPAGAVAAADPDKLRTVLRNVLDNALKYSRDDSEPVRISIERVKDFVRIAVRDDGIGIPREELPYVFEPFYRVDKSRSKKTGGFGLGLRLCKAIVEAHEGRIEVDSEPGGGTTITVLIPKAKPGIE